MEHFKKILNFRTSAGAAHHIITQFGEIGGNWGKFGANGANFGGIGGNFGEQSDQIWHTSERQDFWRGSAPQAERSLNTNPRGSWG